MKKNIFTALIAMLLVLCMAMPALAEAASIEIVEPAAEPTATPEPQPVEVPANVSLAYRDGSINLRAGAGTEFDVVTSLKDGEDITVILYGDIWSKIVTETGKEGYIKNLYINDGNPLYAAGIEYYGTAREMTAAIGVNMFAGASGETTVIVALQPGEKLTALGENGTYTLVSTKAGAQGFVKTSYLSK